MARRRYWFKSFLQAMINSIRRYCFRYILLAFVIMIYAVFLFGGSISILKSAEINTGEHSPEEMSSEVSFRNLSPPILISRGTPDTNNESSVNHISSQAPTNITSINSSSEIFIDLTVGPISQGIPDESTQTLSANQSSSNVNSTKATVINPYEYSFVINQPNYCAITNSDPLLLTIVHSTPNLQQNRMAIRATWANNSRLKWNSKGPSQNLKEGPYPNVNMKVLFAMGITNNSDLMNQIQQESDRFGDIIQADFIDSYKNLTRKAMMWMKWSSTYCSNAFYIMKVDDDVLVNRLNIIKLIRSLYDNRLALNRSLICLVWDNIMLVDRNNQSKWHVTEDEYPDERQVYDTYCSGAAYMISGDLPKLLFDVALKTKYFWIDDVFVTGLLPRELENITYHNIESKLLLQMKDLAEAKNLSETLFFMHLGSWNLKHMYTWWQAIMEAAGFLVESANSAVKKSAAKIVALVDLLKSQPPKGPEQASAFDFTLNSTTGVFEVGGKPIIWQYWPSDEVPKYVRLLSKAMQCRNPEFRVITVHDSTLFGFLPDLFLSKPVFGNFAPEQKSQAFRVAILLKYGGVYADLDLIPLDKLYPIYGLLAKYDWITPNWDNETLCTKFIGPVKADTHLFEVWQANQLKAIIDISMLNHTGNRSDIDVIDLIKSTIPDFTNYLHQQEKSIHLYNGYSTLGQLLDKNLDLWRSFADQSSNLLPLKWTPALILPNSIITEELLEIMTMTELLPRDATVFSALVACALKKCDASEGSKLDYDMEEALKAINDLDKICEKINVDRSFLLTDQ